MAVRTKECSALSGNGVDFLSGTQVVLMGTEKKKRSTKDDREMDSVEKLSSYIFRRLSFCNQPLLTWLTN